MRRGMKTHLHLHQIKLTDAIREFAISKISRLESLADDIQSAEITLTHGQGINPEKEFSVTVRLALPGKDVHATETQVDLYAAIDAVRDKLARQLRKRKTRRIDTRRQKHQRKLQQHRAFGFPDDALLPAF